MFSVESEPSDATCSIPMMGWNGSGVNISDSVNDIFGKIILLSDCLWPIFWYFLQLLWLLCCVFDIKLQYYGLYLDFRAFLQQRKFQYGIYGDIDISREKTNKRSPWLFAFHSIVDGDGFPNHYLVDYCTTK